MCAGKDEAFPDGARWFVDRFAAFEPGKRRNAAAPSARRRRKPLGSRRSCSRRPRTERRCSARGARERRPRTSRTAPTPNPNLRPKLRNRPKSSDVVRTSSRRRFGCTPSRAATRTRDDGDGSKRRRKRREGRRKGNPTPRRPMKPPSMKTPPFRTPGTTLRRACFVSESSLRRAPTRAATRAFAPRPVRAVRRRRDARARDALRGRAGGASRRRGRVASRGRERLGNGAAARRARLGQGADDGASERLRGAARARRAAGPGRAGRGRGRRRGGEAGAGARRGRGRGRGRRRPGTRNDRLFLPRARREGFGLRHSVATEAFSVRAVLIASPPPGRWGFARGSRRVHRRPIRVLDRPDRDR